MKLDRTQLKYLAIIAMVVDHTAWGFVDFMSPLGQVMHIFGRLTLPIMCFFIAEGYRHTSDLKKYIMRMMTFAVVSIIPFYLFFHEEYYFRQNIIFDLTLALLALSVMEHRKWSAPVRHALVALLILVSLAIGGWVVLPIAYVLIFYYGKTFREKARNFIIATLVLEVVLIILIVLNQTYHFSVYEWTIRERLYLIGFILALIPLYMYNGEPGKSRFGRYFFFLFYPLHFMVLFGIKYLIIDYNMERLYIDSHVIALALGLLILLYVLRQPVSRAQMAVAFFLAVGNMYVFGFLLEITTHEVGGVLTATRLQYFSEALVMLAVTFCVQEMCHTRIPGVVYALEGVSGTIVLYALFTYGRNDLMYKDISINTDGPFPRMQITGYGPAFYLFLGTFLAVCVLLVVIGIYNARQEDPIQKKRLRFLLYGMITMWVSFAVKPLNLTGGYEIPALFIPFTELFIVLALVRYNYLDSISLNMSNAVDRGHQGLLIIDANHRVIYHTEQMHEIFGSFERYDDIYRIPGARDVFEGSINKLEKGGHTYELRLEPLVEQGHNTGNILWAIDLTEHYEYVSRIENFSTHDDLTGILTRQAFKDRVEALFEAGHSGGFYMIDLDKFKDVNDTYGHQAGDAVLVAVSDTLRSVASKFPKDMILAGRLGGDEFCLFYTDTCERVWLDGLAKSLIQIFEERLEEIGQGGITSLSIGIAIAENPDKYGDPMTYKEAYKRADSALYDAKEAGRATFCVYTEE